MTGNSRQEKARMMLALALLLAAPAGALTLVAVDEPPGSYIDADGRVAGIGADVVREIQRRVGNNDPLRLAGEAQALALATTQPDVVAFGFSRTNSREADFHWLVQLYRKPWQVYAAPGSHWTLDGLEGLRALPRLGVVTGDVRARWLQEQGLGNLVAVARPGDAVRRLLAGETDALFLEPQAVAWYCRTAGCPQGPPRAVWSPRSSDVYVLMSRQTAPDTVRRWREAAAQARSDGSLGRILQQWRQRLQRDYGIETRMEDGVLVFR